MQVDLVLIGLNIVIYISLIAGVIQGRRRTALQPPTAVAGKFGELESALKRSFPDLPEGFTIREGLSRANSTEPDLGWDQIDRSLQEYEAHRYGGQVAPSSDEPELEKLIERLRKRGGMTS